MSNAKLHSRTMSFTRAVIAMLALIAIWGGSPVAATISTLMWVYMPIVVRYEEKLIKRVYK